MDFIHCNAADCFQTWDVDQRQFYLTDCGHIFCHSCLQKDNTECLLCKKTYTALDLSTQLTDDIKAYFASPHEASIDIRKQHDHLQQVLQFQTTQIKSLVEHLKTKIVLKSEQIKELERKLQVLHKENVYWKKLLETSSTAAHSTRHSHKHEAQVKKNQLTQPSGSCPPLCVVPPASPFRTPGRRSLLFAMNPNPVNTEIPQTSVKPARNHVTSTLSDTPLKHLESGRSPYNCPRVSPLHSGASKKSSQLASMERLLNQKDQEFAAMRASNKEAQTQICELQADLTNKVKEIDVLRKDLSNQIELTNKAITCSERSLQQETEILQQQNKIKQLEEEKGELHAKLVEANMLLEKEKQQTPQKTQVQAECVSDGTSSSDLMELESSTDFPENIILKPSPAVKKVQAWLRPSPDKPKATRRPLRLVKTPRRRRRIILSSSQSPGDDNDNIFKF